jgi:hypothetical protein
MKLLYFGITCLFFFSIEIHAHEELDSKYQHCYAQIKQLKFMYYAIKHSSGEEFIAKHPPEAEGFDRDRAEALVKEIEADEHPQAWIEAKWTACMSEANS